MSRSGVTIQGFDVIDITKQISRLNKKQQAVLLSNIESILGKNSKQFELIRKLVLDSTNDYSRSVVSLLFGDISF